MRLNQVLEGAQCLLTILAFTIGGLLLATWMGAM